MRTESHHGTHGLTHLTWHTPDLALVRWFKYPLGEMHECGQPVKDWDWLVVIQIDGPVLRAYGAKGFPPMEEFRDILAVAATLADDLWFEHRWKPHTFSLSKYKPKPKQHHA